MASGLGSLQSWIIPAAEWLVHVATLAGLNPRVTSARRSHTQQALLYRRFLAGQSRFPAAPPGSSAHELGLAFDLWVNDESSLADLGEVWEKQAGGTWGGHFKDPIHFEAGGLKSVTYQQAAQSDPQSSLESTISSAFDLPLSFVPGVSEITTAAAIAQLAGAKHPILDKLSSGTWVAQHLTLNPGITFEIVSWLRSL